MADEGRFIGTDHLARHPGGGACRPHPIPQRAIHEAAIAVGELLDALAVPGPDAAAFPARIRNEVLGAARAFERIGYPVQGPNRVVRP